MLIRNLVTGLFFVWNEFFRDFIAAGEFHLPCRSKTRTHMRNTSLGVRNIGTCMYNYLSMQHLPRKYI